jgi:signal transduction histidine kinase
VRSNGQADRGPRNNPLVVDGLIAVGLTALSLLILAAGARDLGGYDPLSIGLLLLQTLPLAFRRIQPVPVLAVTLTATIAHAWFAPESLTTTLGSLIALFTVGERLERRHSAVAAAIALAAFGGVILAKAPLPASLSSLVQTEMTVFVAWVLGTWARDRQAHLGIVEERAKLLERERETNERRAVTEERERIARELHDVVTHHVSVIVIQAGAAIRALDRRPDDARQALTAIDGTARQALSDMRRMLGILGSTPDATEPRTAEGDAALAPMPGLGNLGQLLEQVRAAGLPVELSVTGQAHALDPGIELSAYRIVQEALTNTLKHAHGARARVDVRYGSDTLEVRVTDEGGSGERGIGVAGEPGHGLIGMRERVALFGGELDAGPQPGGFRVVARLPLAAATGSA